MLSALNGCGSGGTNAATADIRQAGVTISASPVFPYDPLTANQYTLLVSNHTSQEVSLVASKILNSSLPESVNLSEIVDTSSCQEIAAGANCSLSVKLPYVKTNGYLDFSLDYQDKLTAKNYPISKLIAFSRDIAESNGMLYSLKYSEKIIVNSDKFTFALPLSLKHDYAKLELQLAGQKAGGYSAINCDGYSNHSNCTVIVELDSHIAHPKLSLKTTDKNGLKNTISLMLNVEFNNTAHLVYLNAPPVVRATDSAVEVTVVNIGTATATNVTTPWTPSANIDLTQSSNCGTQLKLNEICKLTYGQRLWQAGGVGTQQQAANYYFSGAQGVQTDKFNVYRNSTALSAPSIDSVYPTNNEVVDNVKPVITVGFTQAVDSDTVNDSSFYVTQGTDMTHLPGTIVFSANNAITFTPTADLIRGAEYHLTLKTNQIGNSAGKVSTIPNATEVIDFTIKQPIITISPDSAAEIIMGDSFRFTASINNTTSPTISSVSARFVNPLDGVITLDPASCDLSAAVGIKRCSFSVVVTNFLSWNPSLTNGLSSGYQIIVSASGSDIKLVGNSLSFTMNTPMIYLAATGQTATTPISASEGMDGWYQAGAKVSSRFTIGTGVEADCITDNLTGLMWVKDLKTINGGKSTTWQGALDLIANANVGSGFCGHKDWYLPTINDLSSLIDYSSPNPSTWLNTQGFINVSRSTYWSSTTYARDTNRVHVIDMLRFNITMLPGTTNGVIWPVRGLYLLKLLPHEFL